MDFDGVSFPDHIASKLLDQVPHRDDRLDVVAVGHHHTTWRQLQRRGFTIGHDDRHLFVAALGLSKSQWS